MCIQHCILTLEQYNPLAIEHTPSLIIKRFKVSIPLLRHNWLGNASYECPQEIIKPAIALDICTILYLSVGPKGLCRFLLSVSDSTRDYLLVEAFQLLHCFRCEFCQGYGEVFCVFLIQPQLHEKKSAVKVQK